MSGWPPAAMALGGLLPVIRTLGGLVVGLMRRLNSRALG